MHHDLQRHFPARFPLAIDDCTPKFRPFLDEVFGDAGPVGFRVIHNVCGLVVLCIKEVVRHRRSLMIIGSCQAEIGDTTRGPQLWYLVVGTRASHALTALGETGIRIRWAYERDGGIVGDWHLG